MSYWLFCYGKPSGDLKGLRTLRAAKTQANAHIRYCPEGHMEWATRIRWHEVGGVYGVPRGWVAAARGEWLNHRIDEVADS